MMFKGLCEVYAGVVLLFVAGNFAYFGKKGEIETAFKINIGVLIITVAIGAIVIISSGLKGLFV